MTDGWIVWGTHGEPVDHSGLTLQLLGGDDHAPAFVPAVRLTRAHAPRGDGLTACGLRIPFWATVYPADAADRMCPRCLNLAAPSRIPPAVSRVYL